MNVKNYNFSRLEHPPVPGKTGVKKAKVMVFDVFSMTGPNDDGMYVIKTMGQATPCGTMDVRALASPNASDIAFYVSVVGCHSVIHFRDQLWAVMAVINRYHQDYKNQEVVVIKSGSTFKHTSKTGMCCPTTTWPGLSEESKKFVQECIEEHAFK